MRQPASVASLVLGVIVSATAVSCNGAPDSANGDENVATNAAAITGGVDDSDSDIANTVVRIGENSCTGTLITPKIVLTAGHCIVGGQHIVVGTPCATDPRPTIGMGANNPEIEPGTTSYWTRNAVDAAAIPTGCVQDNQQGEDVGLYYLDPAQPVIQNIRIIRPSLTAPSAISGRIYADVGVAGWSAIPGSDGISHFYHRQAAIYATVPLTEYVGDLGYFWEHSGGGFVTMASGDSGGPLFIAEPVAQGQSLYNGARDPIGVLSGGLTDPIDWADITQGANRDWILAHVLDENYPPSHPGHTAKWLAQHGKTLNDFWYGEVDYVGACDTQRDPDCDHWYDEHDNCPLIANTDQTDSFDTGVGDVCRRCPCDPGNDADKDSVCGPSCTQGTPGCPASCAQVHEVGEVDNCPLVSNPLQEDCNALSEQTLPADILGDACDPVPCPQSDADSETNHVNCTIIPGTNPPNEWTQCYGFAVHDTASVSPIGAHVRTPTNATPVEVTLPEPVLTTVRYCQARTQDESPIVNGLPLAFDCHKASVINDAELAIESNSLDSDHPWHGITAHVGPFNLAPDSNFLQSYGGGITTNVAWNYQQDLASWLANSAIPTIPLPVGNPSCLGTAQERLGPTTLGTTCLNGTFWFHGYTSVGAPGDNIVAGVNVGTHAAQLANNYVDEVPDDNLIAYCPTVSLTSQIIAQAVANTDRQGAGPQPVIVWPSIVPGAPRQGFEIRPRPDTELLVSSEIGAGILQDNGALIATHDLPSGSNTSNCGGSSVDQTFATSFADRKWVSAVEPDARVGRHPELLAFALSQDATSVVDTAVVRGNLLRSGSYVNCDICPPGGEVVHTNVVSGAGPSSRSSFVSFYSRALNALVVAGGKDASGGELHDLWLYDVDSSAWGQLRSSGVSFGSILDATFSFADQNFYVVDRSSVDREFDVVRIVRMDAVGGAATVLKFWVVAHAFRSGIVLSLDRDGTPLLTVANDHAYTVVRLSPQKSGLTAHVVDVGLGKLALRPIVSRESYAFMMQQPDGSARVVRKTKLASCDDHWESDRDRHDVERCFR